MSRRREHDLDPEARERIVHDHRAAELAAPDIDDVELADAVALGGRLAALAETEPDHPLVLAARLAVEIADARAEEHRALREAAADVHAAAPPGTWRDLAWEPTWQELQTRRYPPGGDVDAWVAGG